MITLEQMAGALNFLAKKCPTVGLPFGLTKGEITLFFWEDAREKTAEIVNALGGIWEKSSNDATYNLTQELEPGIKIVIRIFHEYVCTREVIGKRLVPAREAKPAHEEDVVRWICPESILKARGENKEE